MFDYSKYSYGYWDDEEKKPKREEEKCYHIWVEKPLFNIMHKECEKCGITYDQYQRERENGVVAG